MSRNSTNQKANVDIEELNIENSDYDKLLGIKIDNEFTFDCHCF